jgi:hypothetical protein
VNRIVLLEEVASDASLDRAYAWLCEQRKAFPENAEVWTFRHRWPDEKPRLRADLLAGRYRFAPLYRVTLSEDGDVDVWRARDVLVLKALTLVLAPHLPVLPCCTHVKGHGGAKATLREIWAELPAHTFVCRTDVKDYYASIDHGRLFADLMHAIPDHRVAPLLWQYLRRVSERGGVFREFTRGIALGCPLSPLIGAFHLTPLDRRMQALPVFYRRFMDDIIMLAPTRWKLRRAVAALNEELSVRGLEKHPRKTVIGRTARGFDYLGYHVSAAGLRLSHTTVEQFRLRLAARLYEQEHGDPRRAAMLRDYPRRFRCWARAGLGAAPLRGSAAGGNS